MGKRIYERRMVPTTCERCGCEFQTPARSPSQPLAKYCSYGCRHGDIATRFWSRVEKTEACWLWTGLLSWKGYGITAVHQRHVGAHRLAYELAYGPIPPGMFICHHCDNRRCVRPDHLFLGTAQDNTDDMLRKGRESWAVGERGGLAVLTEAQVREARERYRRGEGSHRSLALEYGISKGAMCHILTYRTWKHVA